VRRRSPLAGLTAGGTEGNGRLTVLTGALLIVMLAVLGVTIVRIGQLLWLHLFVGLMLLGPVALKLASTGYRFARYYTHDPAYVGKGPPALALRLLGPLVILTTLLVFASGIALLLIGPGSKDALLLLHKASFIVWLVLTGLHVLGHLPELEHGLLGSDRIRSEVLAAAGYSVDGRAAGNGSRPQGARRAPRVPGSGGRAVSLAAALAGGLALALALIPQFSPWLHFHNLHN